MNTGIGEQRLAVGSSPGGSPGPMVRVQVRYFAVLREEAGRAEEPVQTAAPTAGDLYREVARDHGFSLPVERVKVAVDGEFASWELPLRDGMQLAFIPPVAGG